MNFPIVSKLLGVVMLTLALAFSMCLGVAYLLDGPIASRSSHRAFIAATLTALIAAGAFLRIGRAHSSKFFRKEALCIIGIGWLLASLVGSIPYMMILPEMGIAGAIFESASGLTTTGASVLFDLETLPPSLLFWRSLSQWIGGIGVVVFFVAVLGFIGVGARMLYANEASGVVSEFEESRIQSTVARLILLYLFLSVACAFSYWLADMSVFDAINHAFATVSTGGFSTRSASLAAFESPAVEWIAVVFMVLGGMNFLLVIRLLMGRLDYARRNTELKAYLLILGAATALIAIALIGMNPEATASDALRDSAVQVVSLMTTTGFASKDYAQWPAVAQITLLVLMLIGGCSGSTSGGMKVSRIVVATRMSMLSIERSFRSRVVRQIRLNNNILTQQAVTDVTNYLVLAGGLFLASMVLFSLFEPGHEVDTSISAVFACFFNIGPGIAEVGPMANYGFLRPYTKVFLALLMIMGRLELFAILALFSPSLWKRFS